MLISTFVSEFSLLPSVENCRVTFVEEEEDGDAAGVKRFSELASLNGFGELGTGNPRALLRC